MISSQSPRFLLLKTPCLRTPRVSLLGGSSWLIKNNFVEVQMSLCLLFFWEGGEKEWLGQSNQ